MKILEIIQQDRAVKDFLLLRAKILKSEFNIDTVFVCWKGPFSRDINQEFKVYNVDFSRGINPLKDLKAIKAVNKIINKEQPDIIHTHFSKPGLIGRIASRKYRKRIKVVHQVHGYYFDRFEKGLKRFIYIFVEKYLSRNFTDYLLFQNHDNLQFAKANSFLTNSNGYFYLGNGIDLKKYQYMWQKRNNNEVFRLVTIGRLEPVKNHAQLLKAVNLLKQRLMRPIRLDIVGEGILYKKLKQLTKQLNIDDIAHFLGRRDDIPEILKNSDCFVLTSKAEGKPRVVMEAMAVGVPVIATDVSGTRDLIQNGKNGYLVPLDDYEELAKKIKAFMLNDEISERFSLNGKKFVEEECDEYMVAKKMGIYFKEILVGRR